MVCMRLCVCVCVKGVCARTWKNLMCVLVRVCICDVCIAVCGFVVRGLGGGSPSQPIEEKLWTAFPSVHSFATVIYSAE